MVLKLGTYLAHHVPDRLRSGTLIGEVAKHGRNFIEGFVSWGGRGGAGVGVKVLPVVVRSNASSTSLICRIQKPTVFLKNAFNGLFLRSHSETLASRFSPKINPQPYWSTFRSSEQFRSLGKRLATYSFVGIGFAGSFQQRHQFNAEDGVTNFDEVCHEMQKMFNDKLTLGENLLIDSDKLQVTLDGIQLGELITTRSQVATFEAKVTFDACVNKPSSIEEDSDENLNKPEEEVGFVISEEQEIELSDFPSIENGINHVVELVSDQQRQLNDIFQVACDGKIRLTNMIEHIQEQVTDCPDDDESSCSSIEVLSNWIEEESYLENLDISYDGEIDSTDADELFTRFDEVVAMVKKQQNEITNLVQVASSQTKRIENLISTSESDVGYNMAMKVTWMTDCSVDSATQLLMNELLPAADSTLDTTSWNGLKLPSHFNIAPVIGGFLATLHDIKEISTHPEILPVVRNWQQDIAVCVIAKRYEFTLAEYLSSHTLGISNSMMIFLQLLEAVVHMSNHNICHRDLKCDNIFVEILADGPHLLVSNFGSSFRFKTKFGFFNLFSTDEVPICNYSYLMSPELVNSSSHADYTKADLWACGAIGYEIFGSANPFRRVHGRDGHGLSSSRYHESDLPSLSSSLPLYVHNLLKKMLKRDPSKRPEPELVANALHISMWAPNHWKTSMPNRLEIKRWLVKQAAELYCKSSSQLSGSNQSISHVLKMQFLSRATLLSVTDALHILHCAQDNET